MLMLNVINLYGVMYSDLYCWPFNPISKVLLEIKCENFSNEPTKLILYKGVILMS